jgi:ATP-dependent Clp protease adaptor protein ClpS
MTDTDTKQKARTKIKVTKPGQYNVVLLNDDFTEMQFVIEILQSIFHRSLEEASQIMLNVHEQGKGIAGTYTLEIAETKAIETIQTAQINGFPLQAVVEKE